MREISQEDGAIKWKIMRAASGARAHGHQVFKYGVSGGYYSDAKLRCNVTTDLVGVNKTRVVPGKAAFVAKYRLGTSITMPAK